MAEPIKILYEDADILVCDKQPGVPVQSARLGMKSMESLLKTYLREKEAAQQENKQAIQSKAVGNRQVSKEPYLAVVHRLDQPVRGILVFAKNKQAASFLSAQVQDGRMEKIYLARVYVPDSNEAQPEGELTDLLVKDAKTNLSRVVSKKAAGAKTARLSFKRLENSDYAADAKAAPGRKTAVYRIHLHTGRHHQIRVQMSHAGMPLVGDHKYAAGIDENRFPCLCAASLAFIHPGSGKKLQFSLYPVE